jgi:hypothetical protein
MVLSCGHRLEERKMLVSPKQQQQQQQDLPPPFEFGGNALEVFSKSFFEPQDSMKGRRRELLAGKSIRHAMEEYLVMSGSLHDARVKMAESLGVGFRRLSDYFDAADMATRQLLAAALFKERSKYNCEFRECTIPAGTIQESLLPLLQVGGRAIDLSFLADLRSTPDDPFLCSGRLYVRDCMRFVFGLLHEDATAHRPRRPPSNRSAAVLIGSPGVGKSILLFLAALHQAMSSPVVYYRKTRDELVSVFVMTPPDESDDLKMVRVWFTRDMDSTTLPQGLKSVAHDLIRSGIVDRKVFYTFIDGPTLPRANNTAQTQDTIDGNFDYFCTSGGFRGFADEQMEKRLWVLDGWNLDDAVAALSLRGESEENAEAVFALCGGCIRSMIRATIDADEVEAKLNGSIDELGKQAVALAATSTKRSSDPDHPDRLRIMFEQRGTASASTRKKYMRAYQVVDSRHALQRLCAEVDMGPFREAYALTRINELGTGQGVFFEHIIHQFAKNKTMVNMESDPVKAFDKVCFSSGTNRGCVEQLSSPNLYWVPSNHNFPNVDSALVTNRTLYAFQMTISGTHKFDQATFKSGFLDQVREKVEHDRVVVMFLHPDTTDFALPNQPSRPETRSGGGRLPQHLQGPPIEFRKYGVKMESEGSISQSLTAFFNGL